MMSEARNTQAVKDCYAAFLRGDVNTILNALDDLVEWHAVIGTEGVAPHAGVRRGKPAVAEFFGQVAKGIAFDQFEPQEFVAQGDAVVAIGKYRGKTLPNGGPFNTTWTMIFNFRDGKIVRFREYTDSAQLVRAYTAAAVVA
jgi:ketosteroid isomerase-like protein